jgi:O-antigen biosynthesis protein
MMKLLQSLGKSAGFFVLLTLWLCLSLFLYVALLLTSGLGYLFRRPQRTSREPLFTGATRPPCSIVIPTWNGKDLLERYLPALVKDYRPESGDELIVVDNASTDGTAEFLREHYPELTHLAMPENLGFGEGCNAGIRAAHNPIVVLLNNDMRVTPGFLDTLTEPFQQTNVFAVSAQILFTDPAKRREESGLTYARFRGGEIELGHNVSDEHGVVTPCFYPGGGSSAFDREMLLEIGGFDHLYQPFYLEDTDLGFAAWRRGWQVLYQPASIVYHEHRGTIGKHFDASYIQRVVSKNRILFQWKHLHAPALLAKQFLRLTLHHTQATISPTASRASAIPLATLAALKQLPQLFQQRFQTAQQTVVSDRVALSLHQPDIYFDRCQHEYRDDAKLSILLVSPYPLYPARHGGAVLITQTLDYLCTLCDVHLVVVLEDEEEREVHEAQAHRFASLNCVVRGTSRLAGKFGLQPKAVREFDIPELRSLIPRLVQQHRIDVLQLEYTNMAQYAKAYRSLVTSLFEHDVYFQTVGRRILTAGAAFGPRTVLEYLRALHYEIRALQEIDYVQVCTEENQRYLQEFVPGLAGRVDANLRAGIRLSAYPFFEGKRLPNTLLFVGNFRHTPNREGLAWLLNDVMPSVIRERPDVVLRVVGANADCLELPSPLPDWLDLHGEVAQVQPHLEECTLFVCPVLTGSGVRVKLLEAYATGIPVVSTTIGAEGLSQSGISCCHLADQPVDFAKAILDALALPGQSREMAKAARTFVEQEWNAEKNTRLVEQRYREFLAKKRSLYHGQQLTRQAELKPTATT